MCDVVRPVPAEMFNEYGEYIGHYCNIAIANKDQMSLYNKEELQLKVCKIRVLFILQFYNFKMAVLSL